MRLRCWALVVILMAVFSMGCVGGPKDEKVYRVGILQMTEVLDISVAGFKNGMREFGYEEDRNIVYIYRNANGDVEKLRLYAREMVEADVDLIFSLTTVATLAAAEATRDTQLPIVFTPVMEPVRSGLVKSIENPGGRITGVSPMVLASKQLEILLEAKPDIRTLGLISSFDHPVVVEQMREAARSRGIVLLERRVERLEEVPGAAEELAGKVDAIYVPPDNIVTKGIPILAAAAKKARVPLMVPLETGVREGALLTYSADYYELGVTAARMADQIFNGKRPGDIPVEFPLRPRLIINQDTAREIGLNISPELLHRATEIVGEVG
jgi:putative ABC transport system substrate-binding protein